MKKFGFTLAEVLITLAVIGVIATMTAPIYTERVNTKANIAKLASTVSAIENALSNMIVTNAATNLKETEFWSERNNNDNPNAMIDELRKYLKFENLVSNPNNPSDYYLVFKNGVKITLTPNNGDESDELVAVLTIDTNGRNNPNAWGIDCFKFAMGSDGVLYPAEEDSQSVYKEMGAENVSQVFCSGDYSLSGPAEGKGQEYTSVIVNAGYKVK